MTRPAIGIISMGEMGSGVARLLEAHHFQVFACVEDRSDATKRRAASAGVNLVASVEALVKESDVILSIVPPHDAVSTATTVRDAMNDDTAQKRNGHLTFLDLNAISPALSQHVYGLLSPHTNVTFIDGGIIGGPPKPNIDCKDHSWTKPSLILSGPVKLCECVPGGDELENVLNVNHISNQIGSATGLKMCFASLSKGFTGLAIQAFTTAHQLGVLNELKSHLQEFNPGAAAMAERGLVDMPPKASRWIFEMEEISKTMRDEGGFDSRLFDEIAKLYNVVASHPILGAEKSESRVRGKSSQDVASLIAENFNRSGDA